MGFLLTYPHFAKLRWIEPYRNFGITKMQLYIIKKETFLQV